VKSPPATRGLPGSEEARAQRGFTLVEMMLAGTVGMLVVGSGFMLYRSQTSMHLRQGDVTEAQLTVDYVVNTLRTMVVSAGGGLPQGASGLRKSASGRGLSTYVNRGDLSTTVVDELNLDLNDGVLPVSDVSLFDGSGFVMVSHNEDCLLGEMQSVNVAAKTLTLKDPSLETKLAGADFVYPVEYCSLYVDTLGSLRKTILAEGAAQQNIPLAVNIDSLDVSFDVSADGNGGFTRAITDSSKVSRVKVFVRVKGAHVLAGKSKRSFETIVGVRRGRLYNRAM
jgi:Prokaryotic N-terminal methylation motif